MLQSCNNKSWQLLQQDIQRNRTRHSWFNLIFNTTFYFANQNKIKIILPLKATQSEVEDFLLHSMISVAMIDHSMGSLSYFHTFTQDVRFFISLLALRTQILFSVLTLRITLSNGNYCYSSRSGRASDVNYDAHFARVDHKHSLATKSNNWMGFYRKHLKEQQCWSKCTMQMRYFWT